MTEGQLRRKYLDWIVEKIEYDKVDWNDYNLLIRELHRTTFVWSDETPELAMDENRAKDGEYLRVMFEMETGYRIADLYDDIGKECSMLEMMVALSIRIDNEIMGVGYEEYGQWFYAMLKNLRLLKYTDYNFEEVKVRQILRHFLEKSGDSFIFKTVTSDRNFLSLEIWDQMSCWLNEKYGEKCGFL